MSLPTTVSADPDKQPSPPVPLWKLLVAIAAWVLALDLAESFPWGTVAVFGVAFAALDFVALKWGRDSRDGADWKPPGSERRARTSPV